MADLLQNRPSLQKLRGVGEPIDSASFVRKGTDSWGLQLRLTPEIGPEDPVFDLTNRRFCALHRGVDARTARAGRLADPAHIGEARSARRPVASLDLSEPEAARAWGQDLSRERFPAVG